MRKQAAFGKENLPRAGKKLQPDGTALPELVSRVTESVRVYRELKAKNSGANVLFIVSGAAVCAVRL